MIGQPRIFKENSTTGRGGKAVFGSLNETVSLDTAIFNGCLFAVYFFKGGLFAYPPKTTNSRVDRVKRQI